MIQALYLEMNINGNTLIFFCCLAIPWVKDFLFSSLVSCKGRIGATELPLGRIILGINADFSCQHIWQIPISLFIFLFYILCLLYMHSII